MSVQNRADSPTVQITTNRNRLKVYDKKSQLPKVYLNNNSHFEFEFFNPTQERIGIIIYLNNKCINTGRMLIIRPGDRGFLERYLTDGDAKKFLFDTYVVNGGNEQVKKAIEKNGHIKIEFYKEQEYLDLQDHYATFKIKSNQFNGYNNFDNNTSIGGYVGHTRTCNANYSSIKETGNISDTSLNFFDSTSNQLKSAPKKMKASKNIETGRIEKGEASDQTFEYTTFSPEYTPFHIVTMQIMPESTKQIDIKHKRKLYCPGCRYRIRDINWKWCPKCQTDLSNI